MGPAFLIFCITFFYVFAKAFQQRNVVFNKFWSIPIVSYIMAYCELAGFGIGVLDIANNGWDRLIILGFAHGTGGTLGCWSAIWLHRKVHKDE